MRTVIYGLMCPLAQRIRYVGKSTDPDKRFYAHIYSANRSGTHKQRWMAKLVASGLKPSIVILEVVGAGGDWAEAERRWIAHGKKVGWPLTNLAAGGEGSEPLGADAKLRKKAQMSRPEARRRMSESAKARWSDADKRERALAALTSAERRKRQSESAKARSTPEYRQMMSERSKAAWADPEKRGRIVAGITQETRAEVSAAAKRMWSSASEEKRRRMSSNLTQGKVNPDETVRSGNKAAGKGANACPELSRRVA